MAVEWHKNCNNVTLRLGAAAIGPYVFTLRLGTAAIGPYVFTYRHIYVIIQIVLSKYFLETLGITHFRHYNITALIISQS